MSSRNLNPLAILPLPAQTASLLRSSLVATSLADVLKELVENALDAGAKKISVSLDVEAWSLRVEDDGCGMAREAVESVGQGVRYATSKTVDSGPLTAAGSSTFGFRGEALASLAATSLLEIVSNSGSQPTWCSIIRGGKHLSSGPSARFKKSRPGTTVIVKDLFFNLPVRRSSAPSTPTRLQACVKALETASLLFPEVAIILSDLSKDFREDSGRIWAVSKTSSTTARFAQVHGLALIKSVAEIDSSSGNMRVQGFISLSGAHSRAHQYIYINRHPLAYCDLHKVIESRLERSAFGRADTPGSDKGVPSTRRSRGSPRKMERKAVFVLDLWVPPKDVDLAMEPSKAVVQLSDWNVASDFLGAVVDAFLRDHSLYIPPPTSLRERSIPSPSKRSIPSPSKRSRGPDEAVDDILPSPRPPKRPRRAPADGADGSSLPFEALTQNIDPESGLTRWRDPRSGGLFLVDPKSGNSTSASSNLRLRSSAFQSRDEPHVDGQPGRTVSTMAKSTGVGTETTPSWLLNVLEDWDHASFRPRSFASVPSVERVQDAISLAQDPKILAATINHAPSSSRARSRFDAAAAYFAESAAIPGPSSGHFESSDLLEARVVGQIDRKMIACVIIPSSDSTDANESPGDAMLVMLDQHAADERIRVERYLRRICQGFLNSGQRRPSHSDKDSAVGVKQHTCPPGTLILLTHQEHRVLLNNPASLATLRRWGIDLRTASPTLVGQQESTAYVQVEVSSVPSVVSTRLLGRKVQGEGPLELQELVKGFLGRAAESGEMDDGAGTTTSGRDGPDTSETRWLSALRKCPPELVDLINSKACRGAIMFGDALLDSQSKDLLFRLSSTLFPFQCAHGRPSIAPLTTLPDLGSHSRARRPLDWNSFD